MKIAIFTNNYLPNPYGVSGSIESFRKQFEKQGHSVFIFAPNYKNYKDKNPYVYRFPSLNINYKIEFPLAIPHSPKINNFIKNLDLDIIHSQHPNLLGKEAKKWAKIKNIPLIFTWHTLYDKYTHFVPLIPEKIANKIVIKQAVKYANEANQIIVPTPGIKKIIKNWGVTNEKIEPIATGIEEEFYQNTDRKKIRDKFGIQEKETLLLLVSRITQEKNIEFLFNSVIEILKKNSEVKFLIAGDGYLLPKLKNITLKNNLQNRIFFQGIVEKNELKNYYSAGDIFVYSSKSETQGMVISEAMYCGLPVVAIFAPGVSDLVQTNINGFLIEEKENEFISALEKLIENRNLRNIFSENSKKIARELYTDKVCAQKMLLIYESLIQCHSERV
jgi:glycosyltransferase involved in cell wall biosynthesis